MTRTRTLLVTTALAITVPLAAMAQTPTSTTKCGPVAFSTERMAYSSAPCAGAESAGTVGTSGPTVFGANNSSSMTKAEQKQGGAYGYAPMQSQAVMAGPAPTGMGSPNMASAGMADQSCGSSNAVSIRDEYGRRYNCRGDRVR
jgi:hypothetical protein